MTLLRRAELLPLFLRASGVVAAALSGLVALRTTLHFPQPEGIVTLAVLGWMVFIPLGQWGYGRPAYGQLRRAHERGEVVQAATHALLARFGRQALMAAGAFGILALAFGLRQTSWRFSAAAAVFALGLAALNSGTYQRDAAYALSQEQRYETLELVRRLGLLLGFVALGHGLPLWALGVACLLMGGATQLRLSRILLAYAKARDGERAALATATSPGLVADARRYLLFTANELLLYNFPLVVFTVLGQSTEIIFTSVWLRLFQLLVLPMRLGVDARMNRLVSAHFRHDSQAVLQGLRANVVASALLTAALLLALAWFRETIFTWLGAVPLAADAFLLPSLAVWGLANTVQHAYGSFTLSYGGGFAFAGRASLVTVIGLGLVFAALNALQCTAGQIFLGTGLLYALCAMAYPVHVQRMLRLQPDPA